MYHIQHVNESNEQKKVQSVDLFLIYKDISLRKGQGNHLGFIKNIRVVVMCDKMRTHCRSLLSLFIEMVSLQVTYTKKSLKQLLALPVYSNWKSTAMDASIEHPLRSSSMPSHISRLVKSGLRPRTDSIYNNIKNMIITSIPTNSSRNRGAGSHRCHTNILLQTRIPGDFACK